MLSEKNIVVTGANRGIGKAIVEACARSGANVWACMRKLDETTEICLQKLEREHNVSIKPVIIDVKDQESVRQSTAQILSEKLMIDGIVNNAGIVGPAKLFSMTGISEIQETFEVNFFGPLYFTQRLLKNLMKNRAGSIVNIASVAALDGEPAQLPYVASKAAIIGATKKLASELAPYHIRVNAIAPGIIDTDMGGQVSSEAAEQILSNSAMKRKGTASEVADLAVYLLSEKASYITGQVLRIDGGMR